MPPVVLALHSSGSPATMWRPLEALPALAGIPVVAPALLGYPPNPSLVDGHLPTRHDDVAHALAALPPGDGPVHLVGHSYGGVVALTAARALGPRVASVWVYEPVIFGALMNDPAAEPEGREEARATFLDPRWAEPGAIGDEAWCTNFIDFWNGAGTFAALPPRTRQAIMRMGPKFAAEARDIFGGGQTFADWAVPARPMTVAHGAATRACARAMAHGLVGANPGAVLHEVPGAGHMAPLNDPAGLVAWVGAHLARAGL